MSIVAEAKVRIDQYHNEDVNADDYGGECSFFKLSDDVGVKYYWHRSTRPRVEEYVKIQDTLAREGCAPRVLSHSSSTRGDGSTSRKSVLRLA